MYAVTSIPLVRRTRATLRKAEFGLRGVVVRTWVQTPRFWGLPARLARVRPVKALWVTLNAGAVVFLGLGLRPLRTSWLIVGNFASAASSRLYAAGRNPHRHPEKQNGSMA